MLRSALRTVTTLAFASLAMAACGGTSNGTNMMAEPDMATPAAPDMTFDPGPYPDAPYGIKVGDTLFNVSPNGYALSPENSDVTTLDFAPVPLSIIREQEKCTCLMISKSATWCGPCNEEQGMFATFMAENPGFCVYNILKEGPRNGTGATKQDVLNWIETHHQQYPVVMGSIATEGRIPSYHPTPQVISLPSNILVNPRTMKILDISAGASLQTLKDAKAMCDADK